MKHIYILLAIMVVPFSISAVTYINKTGHPLTISKTIRCSQDSFIDDSMHKKNLEQETRNTRPVRDEIYESRVVYLFPFIHSNSCKRTESVEILPDHSVDFENDQNQAVTIMSIALNEKREIFPTNDSFNYAIEVERFAPKFSRLKINRAE